MDPDPGGTKTCGSGFGSETLRETHTKNPPDLIVADVVVGLYDVLYKGGVGGEQLLRHHVENVHGGAGVPQQVELQLRQPEVQLRQVVVDIAGIRPLPLADDVSEPQTQGKFHLHGINRLRGGAGALMKMEDATVNNLRT